MQMFGGLSNMVYDRLDGVTYTVGDFLSTRANVTLPQPSGQSAIFVQSADGINWQGGVWTHATHAIAPLIVPPAGNAVISFRTDGQTLVWWEAPLATDPYGANPAGDLFTAPFVTSRSAIVKTRIRAAGPEVSIDSGVAGSGYYAVVGRDAQIHIYRLSDGHHWAVAIPPVGGVIPYYIDETYLVYSASLHVLRQEIAALGPGD